MNYIIILIIIALSFISLYVSLSYKKNNYLKYVSGSLILILGITLFFGIDYPSGEVITDNYNITELVSSNETTTTGTITHTITKQYTNWNNYITKALALILTLAGFLIFIFQPLNQKKVL